ncbi:uncharacterized protein MONBRDRAFT_33870 [Monosiga brevicollis MX1]|uniref:Acid phosphatase n=1 Tax=Monosiga brevicollis TaxID=81824 RepID=A9V819_MONBE|nr:uncharacterized protein MONBRDRAFT_33870 [Monosiga brevicollis MX1]EDQ86262.1 predicted protein [Monosiga brevicollis MX1]|eukprot:XP_001748932.1 hypothetical protein [Monosiga brevicollis MX1]
MSSLRRLAGLGLLLTALPLVLGELKLVQILFRHGDRTALRDLPGVSQPSDWPEGYGQLTALGMQMHYNVGAYFRKRYIQDLSFIDAAYNHEQIVVRSTDADRTLMSAQAQLAGWFPVETSVLGPPDILWRPVPVHTRPVEDDLLLRSWSQGVCPRYDQLEANWNQTQGWHDKNNQIVDPLACQAVHLPADQNCTVAQYLSALEPISQIAPLDLDSLWQISDTLLCRRMHNLSMPDYANHSDVGEASYSLLRSLEDWGMYAMFDSVPKRRLSGGPVLQELISNMQAALQDSSMPRVFLYSGHDTNLAAVLEALQTDHFRARAPPYASCLIVELHVEDDTPFVRIVFKNESAIDAPEHPGHTLTVKTCEHSDCPLSEFVKVMSPILPTDMTVDCQAATPSPTTRASSSTTTKNVPASTIDPTSADAANKRDLTVTAVVVAICLALAVAATFFILFRRRQRRMRTIGTNIKYTSRSLAAPLSVVDDDDEEEDVFSSNYPNAPAQRPGRASRNQSDAFA